MWRQKNPVASEYARLAAQYDTRWSQYVTATVTETLLRLPTNPPRRVLDVACGTGSLLVPLLGKYPGASLTGADLTPEMLKAARRKLPDRVALVSADAEQLPFSSQYFDLVISTNSFHYFRRPRQALLEFHRVLAPHGSLVITDWCDDFITCKICDLVLRVFSTAHGRIFRQDECERLLEASAFEAVQVSSYKISWLWGLMTARARRGTLASLNSTSTRRDRRHPDKRNATRSVASPSLNFGHGNPRRCTASAVWPERFHMAAMITRLGDVKPWNVSVRPRKTPLAEPA